MYEIADPFIFVKHYKQRVPVLSWEDGAAKTWEDLYCGLSFYQVIFMAPLKA